MPLISKGYLGIDPGNSGGAVIISGSKILASTPFSFTENSICEWFEYASDMISHAVIEKVWSYPGQGVASTFTFGKSFGLLIGCLICNGITFEEVVPQKWLKGLGIGTRPKGMRDAAWKGQLMERAKIMFPRQRITKAIADAALIAKYCELTHGKE